MSKFAQKSMSSSTFPTIRCFQSKQFMCEFLWVHFNTYLNLTCSNVMYLSKIGCLVNSGMVVLSMMSYTGLDIHNFQALRLQ